jgi:hypothetical protein
LETVDVRHEVAHVVPPDVLDGLPDYPGADAREVVVFSGVRAGPRISACGY